MRKHLRRGAKWLGILTLIVLGLTLADAWQGLGHRATGERRARMERSPQWKDGAFENPEPIVNYVGPMLSGVFSVSPDAAPHEPVSTTPLDPALLATKPESGLRLTWLGHSTMLIELDGYRVLTDPVWSERVSPLDWVGPTRWYAPLIKLEQLPRIDAVLISHDHYDHLDHRTLIAMKDWDTKFIVPLGVGAHLEYWGIAPEKIVEVDWWDSTKLGALEIISTPVRHASGRHVFDKDATLWSGYALLGPAHRAYFSGDTGLFTALQDIGEKFGPFDVTMLEVGQYHRAWPDWHMGPEQAVTAHQLLRGKVFVPMHWGLVTLAYHSWTEPIERTVTASSQTAVQLVTPRPGQSFEPGVPTEYARWWPKLGYETAEQHAIVSGNVVLRASGSVGASPAK
ncbi:MAG: MBL fold metallo-hydrolase [Archangium sp.]|nr:MBL fold metallo-hydrolase [Archangium sp.]